jgi:hypothetical protein
VIVAVIGERWTVMRYGAVVMLDQDEAGWQMGRLSSIAVNPQLNDCSSALRSQYCARDVPSNFALGILNAATLFEFIR